MGGLPQLCFALACPPHGVCIMGGAPPQVLGAPGPPSKAPWAHVFQILGMAFSMTLFQHIHRTGKKYDA